MTKNLVQGRTGEWEVVIGLEVHAQIISNSKLFSGSPTKFGSAQNSQVSLVDAAMPGMLPVINAYCIEQAVRTGLALGAKINLESRFDRKNYFYADLPQGYQISQFEKPIVGEGKITLDLEDGSTKEVGITRIHMEQDAGKSLHDQHPTKTYVDLNRSGVALMEIVSEPDLRSAEEVAAYLNKLRTIVRYLGTCDGNMDEGSMRCDVNVSVRRPNEELGTRAEIKNVNSIRFAGQAIQYEIARQIELIEDGGEVVQETRLFDAAKNETRSMRSKEEAHDYRYFPCPDLPPLVITQEYVDGIKDTLPELPDAKKERFISEFGLKPYDASVLAASRAKADYFEEVAKKCKDKKLAVTWVTVELFAALNKLGKEIQDSPISSDSLTALTSLIEDNTISGRIAKEVFAQMVETGKEASVIVEEKGLKQITDTSAIEAEIDAVLSENADKVEAYKGGKDKLFGFFVGQTMKRTGGKANPKVVNEILKKKLG